MVARGAAGLRGGPFQPVGAPRAGVLSAAPEATPLGRLGPRGPRRLGSRVPAVRRGANAGVRGAPLGTGRAGGARQLLGKPKLLSWRVRPGCCPRRGGGGRCLASPGALFVTLQAGAPGPLRPCLPGRGGAGTRTVKSSCAGRARRPALATVGAPPLSFSRHRPVAGECSLFDLVLIEWSQCSGRDRSCRSRAKLSLNPS